MSNKVIVDKNKDISTSNKNESYDVAYENYEINNRDYIEICRLLEDKHAIFYKIWQIGKPNFTQEIPTAAVTFNKDGEFLQFIFNPKFWDGLNNYERAFVISHESLHVFLNHGVRFLELVPQLANMAADVVINEMLVNRFGFDREKISNYENYCWIDTVFKDEVNIEQDESFEYYYSKLSDNIETIKIGSNIKILDDHSGLGDISNNVKKVFEKISKGLSEHEKLSSLEFDKNQDDKTKNEYKQAGLHPGTNAKTITVTVKPKKKWETVIKNWVKRSADQDDELWNKRSRRITLLDNKMILPVDVEEDIKRDKIHIWFFQDTSGSCTDLAERFFKAAKSIPKNKFQVQMFCFDTQVYKTDLESGKLYGFGGTSFSCINSFVIKHERDFNIKPHAIFVITDGYGDDIKPKNPEKWHWFLSTDYTTCIDKKCNIYKLEDYE